MIHTTSLFIAGSLSACIILQYFIVYFILVFLILTLINDFIAVLSKYVNTAA